MENSTAYRETDVIVIGAVRVPDGTVDPFRPTTPNMVDACEHGAEVLTYHEVLGLIRQGDRVTEVRVFNHKQQRTLYLYAQVVINAASIWGQRIAEYADLRVRMFPAKGALLILGHHINNMVINRCRKPADADILVPGDTISLIGTTSTRVDYDQIDNMSVTPQEVEILMREGAKLAPIMAQTRILRAYAGVRPLVASDNDPSGRSVSCGIVLLDHTSRDGLEGFVTITGGKLMTYRLMAEWVTDKACEKLEHSARCITAERPLPGSASASTQQPAAATSGTRAFSAPLRGSAIYRHGGRAARVLSGEYADSSLVCECEAVTAGEVRYAVDALKVNNLIDLRRRTRIGMGTCQGELCACRAAGLLCKLGRSTPPQALTQLSQFLNERWKGVRPIAWGNALRESEFTSWVYQGFSGLSIEDQQEEQHAV